MTPPSPEMVKRELAALELCLELGGHELVARPCSRCERIALALTAAHAQGRAEGLEQAAKIASETELCCDDPKVKHEHVAMAIRTRAAEEARRG